jgi:hypothetical protein
VEYEFQRCSFYFTMSVELSPKRPWWKEFLVEFDMTIEYQVCRLNVVTNSLRRKAQPESLRGGQVVSVDMKSSAGFYQLALEDKGRVLVGSLLKEHHEVVKEGQMMKFWVDSELLHFGDCIYV